MVINKNTGLMTADCQLVLDWLDKIRNSSLDDYSGWEDLSEHILYTLIHTVGPAASVVQQNPDHMAFKKIAQHLISDIDYNMPVQESESFEDLPIVLAMKAEFGFTTAQAEEATGWIKGDIDISDRDVWDTICDRVLKTSDWSSEDSRHIEETCFSKVSALLTKKYGISL
jgi:hypothetical protein